MVQKKEKAFEVGGKGRGGREGKRRAGREEEENN